VGNKIWLKSCTKLRLWSRYFIKGYFMSKLELGRQNYKDETTWKIRKWVTAGKKNLIFEVFVVKEKEVSIILTNKS
jgi:hypothetical protein